MWSWSLCLVMAACAISPSDSPSQSTAPSPSPSASAPVLMRTAPDDLFYPSAEAVAAAAPGEIIDAVEIQAPPGVRAWTVVYGSTGLDGQPVAVSGVILAPADPPSTDGYPVIAVAHGTTGIADRCAPSRNGAASAPIELVAKGYVVTATDYEGLGTDGVHPYLIGLSEGRSVLDSVRAVQNLPETHAAGKTVILGLSQGGHAALWAGQLAPTYAPELDVLGSVAGSPPADMSALLSWTVEQAAAGQIYTSLAPLMLYGVWGEAYGLQLSFLTEEGRTSASAAPDGCDPPLPTANPYVSNPIANPEWSQRMMDNSPGGAVTEVPFLVVSPRDDQLVGYDSQVAGVDAMCAIGDTVELWTVTGGHDAMVESPVVWQGTLEWVESRFAGTPVSSTCGGS
jgi:pimeloyl-ACP methyl ester carboxylesterase